jgi:hypothetical protein
VTAELGDVEPVGVVDRRGRVADGDHAVPVVGERDGELRARVPEALDGDGRVVALAEEAVAELVDDVEGAIGGGAGTAGDAAERQRLAGQHGRDVSAADLGVLVGHPPHHELVGRDVGSGDVDVGPDRVGDRRDVAAGEPFELGAAQPLDVDRDPALRATEGQVEQRGLEGHPEGQRGDLVDVDPRVEPDAALRRATGAVVADPVAAEDLQPAVVHAHRDRDLERRPRDPQPRQGLLGDVRAGSTAASSRWPASSSRAAIGSSSGVVAGGAASWWRAARRRGGVAAWRRGVVASWRRSS